MQMESFFIVTSQDAFTKSGTLTSLKPQSCVFFLKISFGFVLL